MGYKRQEEDEEIGEFHDMTVYHGRHSGIVTISERGHYEVMLSRAEALALAAAIIKHYGEAWNEAHLD